MKAEEPWYRLLWSPRAVAVWAMEPRRGGYVGAFLATVATSPFPAVCFMWMEEPFGNAAIRIFLGLLWISGWTALFVGSLAAFIATAGRYGPTPGRLGRVLLLAWGPLLIPLGCFYVWNTYYLLRYYPSFAAPVVWQLRGTGVWIDATIGSCWWVIACWIGWLVVAIRAITLLRTVAPPPIHACPACAYDLRGSIPAGSVACPECGHPIAPVAAMSPPAPPDC